MARWKPVPLPDGSYKDASRPFSDQDLCNYLVEFAETQGTRSPYKLVCPPGLVEFALFGDGPHRGARDVEGKLFVVADTHAYWVKAADDIQQLGTIPGRSLVWIAHNQITNGNEVMFSTGPDAWIWNTVTEVWAKVTDEAFRGARSLDYCNSRFLAIENQRRFFANSALAAGLEWDSLERYEAESCPDRLMCLVVSHNEVLVFNERTIEFFQNTTNPEDIANHIYFTRVGLPVEVGCASVRGAVRMDNAVYFIGSDGGFYRLEGSTPVRVSTHAIEQDWSQHDLSKAFCTVWEDRGHKVVYTTIPSGHTWGYDVATRKWHRRQSKGLKRWRLNTLFKWGGDWYGGAYNSGHIYRLDWDYTKEGCDELDSFFTTGVLHDEGNPVTLHGVRVEYDSGSAESVCVDVEPIVVPETSSSLLTLINGDVNYAGHPSNLSVTTTVGIAPVPDTAAVLPLNACATSYFGTTLAGTFEGQGVLSIWRWSGTAYVEMVITGALPTGTIYLPAISNNGEWVVVPCHTDEAIMVYQYDGAGYTLRTTHAVAGTKPHDVCFSPDESQIAFPGLTSRLVHRLDFNSTTGALTNSTTYGPDFEQHTTIDWYDNYILLGMGGSTQRGVIVTASTMAFLCYVPAAGYIRPARWSARGAHFYYLRAYPSPVIISASFNGTTAADVNTYALGFDGHDIVISKDRRYLFVSGTGTESKLFEANGATLTEITPPPTQEKWSVWTGLPG